MRRFGSKLREVELGGLKIEVLDRPGLYYTSHHEWVEIVGGCPCMEEMIRIGMGDFVCKRYGKPHAFRVRGKVVGSWVQQDEELGRLELETGTAAVLAPIEGCVVAMNRRLQERPDLLVRGPHHSRWIAYIRPATAPREAVEGLLRPDEYLDLLKTIQQEESCDEE